MHNPSDESIADAPASFLKQEKLLFNSRQMGKSSDIEIETEKSGHMKIHSVTEREMVVGAEGP